MPLHFTCLTIGSRGDVQPYIALCKELQKDGHHCRIATHPEYEDWIIGHDIEFRSIGGDPGELMVIFPRNRTIVTVLKLFVIRNYALIIAFCLFHSLEKALNS
jgi:UDP:flavonoid glycosyltransferase YjiC (YdhE family)